MRLDPNSSSAPRIAIMLSAILLGIVIGMVIGPTMLFSGARPNALSYAYVSGAVICIIAFVALGLRFLRSTVDGRHELERNLLSAFLDYVPDNVFFKDGQSRFLRISRAMANYCGMSDPDEAIGKTDADIFSAEHAGKALAAEQEVMRTGQPMIAKEEKETWPDGHETWVLTTKVAMKNREGVVIGTMGIAHNISERKRSEMRIRHMALHDSLTGLPNRVLLEDRLSHAIADAHRNQKHVAVLLVDLDRFKIVNDSFGRYIGDRLLESVSSRLRESLRESDTIARLGGDEFVVVIQTDSQREAVERVAQKVREAMSASFQIENHELQISASIGIAQFPENGDNPQDLLQFADTAMYEAKKRGRGRYCFFTPALTEATRRQQKLENDLLQACARDEFVLHYQPIVTAESGRISGVEALLRWRHPEEGLISPNQFIPHLEELGLMVEVGRWVLKTACRQAVEWQRNGIPPIRMAVNVSSQQFFQGNIVDLVASVLRDTGLDAKLLELELTESQTLDDSPATINIMTSLKRIGVSLSLDDFGTGWSSLSYLRRFPIDRIKIDRSFVRDVASQPAAEAVVKSILSLGRSLGIACIAEGVETREEQAYLKKQACAEMQGFLFSRPLASVDATALLRSVNSRKGVESSSRIDSGVRENLYASRPGVL